MRESQVLQSLEDTQKFASQILKDVCSGSFVGFSGVLGVGKTALIKFLLQQSGVTDKVQSPSYVLENIYHNSSSGLFLEGMAFCHWDLYRLGKGSEIPEELLEYRSRAEEIVLIEWPEQIPGVLKLLDLHVKMRFCESSPEGRIVEIEKA